MSKIVTRTFTAKVLICDCGLEHIIEQDEIIKTVTKAPVVKPVIKPAVVAPVEKPPHKPCRPHHKSYPAQHIDTEQFITDAKALMGKKYANTTQYDRIIRTQHCVFAMEQPTLEKQRTKAKQ